MSKVCAAKQVVSQKTPAQGVTTSARKSTVSALAPIISSLAAKAAATAKLTPAYANNTADNVEKKRIIVTATRPASRLQQIVCAVQCAKIESPQMKMETANTVKTVNDLKPRTQVVTAKSVVSRRKPARGVVKFAKKLNANANAHIVTTSLQRSRKQKRSPNQCTTSCEL